jgi:hypothetical protein
LLERVEASVKVDEGEFQSERGWKGLEDPSAGWDNLATDAIPRDETFILSVWTGRWGSPT